MVDWTDIHQDFAKNPPFEGKTYQQRWEEKNLTYRDAQEWIKVGLTPHDYNFISYLKQNSLTPEWYKNKTSQNLLDLFYANKNQVKTISLNNLKSNQPSELIIADYPNLKKIEGWYIPNLTKLTINNCPQLEKISITSSNNLQQLNLNKLPNLGYLNCSDNQLTQIKLPQGEKLERLVLTNNNLNQDLSFLSGLVNLKHLWLDNNPLVGSLEPLKGISKLRELDIRDTDIDSGLEYLPNSLEDVRCLVSWRKETKVQAIYDLFANDQGEVEADYRSGRIKNFPQKFQAYKQWIKLNFTEQEIKKWINAGFQLNDYNYIQKWIDHGFTDEQAQEWINAGAKADDYEFIIWLRDIKKEISKWITNYQEDYQVLSDRFKKYGLCSECQQPNEKNRYGNPWCQDCNPKDKEEKIIDQFIKNDQSKAIELISYEQFTDIKYLAEGGFGKIYKAEWVGKNDNYNNKPIVLKSLNNSQGATTDFLREVANYVLFNENKQNDLIVKCYGISQDPETGNYLMIMQYINDGDLRKYLDSKYNKISLKDKLNRLWDIIKGLGSIHREGLMHRDFHLGNILKSRTNTCYITDLGLSKLANSIDDGEIFGVLPYVSPEVLQGKPYTQASDIYSFGIIAYELFANSYPYPKLDEIDLASKVCQGYRPNIDKIKIPQELKDLIKRCWDADPVKRPSAGELEKTIQSWCKRNDAKFFQQYQEIEKEYNHFSQNTPYKIHPTAVTTSKLINTKQITQRLKELKPSEEYHTKTLEELTLDNFNLDELNIQEDQAETSEQEQQAQILHNPPKTNP